MKPLNSKEKSKQLWQFIFIFFALCIIPVSLIFFSYYKTPSALSEAEVQKLVNYSEYEHSRKLLVKQIADINEDMVKFAANPPDASIVKERISKKIVAMTTADSSSLIAEIGKSYSGQLTALTGLNEATNQSKKISQDLAASKAELETCKGNLLNANLSKAGGQ